MHLRSVELVNWRSYRHTHFNFPISDGNRNVILIKAPNEYGKTSFFEAITLGLFGREGLRFVPRAQPRVVTNDGMENLIKISYSQFLGKVLHRRATENGPAKCSVSIKADDDTGVPIELTRIWHFQRSGLHKPADDEINILYGHKREPVQPPPGIEDSGLWFRDWIALHFLPPSLAVFFLFDGEQVQQYARQEMSQQVRLGIENLLGLNILNELRDSLANYAQRKRKSVPLPANSVIKEVEDDIATISEDIERNQKTFDKAVGILGELELERDQLSQVIGGRDGTVAEVGNLMKEEARYREEARSAMKALLELIQEDVALAVAGANLRESTRATLMAEAKRERWESGRNEGTQNLDRFALELRKCVDAFDPPLNEKYCVAVVEAGRQAWNSLWNPAPEGCAEVYRHPSIKGTMRDRAIELLLSLDSHTKGELKDQVDRFNVAVEQAEAKKREWQETEATAQEISPHLDRLKNLSENISTHKGQRDEAERAIRSKKSDLSDKQAEFGRYVSGKVKSGPALRHATFADRYATLIPNLVEDAWPNEVNEVAVEMTKAWKKMANHPERVDRIEITPDCRVRMLAAGGGDLHDIDMSAGASQVFTQALILAITKVSGRAFPFIVDTPLARLGRVPRIGVLKTFTDRAGQVILLSTDQEVVDDKLDAIRERLVAAFELTVNHDKGVSTTSVLELDIGKL